MAYRNNTLNAMMSSTTLQTLRDVLEPGMDRSGDKYIPERFNESIRVDECGSNSSDVWLLTSPLCSIKYSSFFTFVIVALILGIITFITIIGNLLVLVALYRFKKLRSMSNCLIGNLAVSDLLLALSVLPISTTYDLVGYWVFGEIMCTIWLCIDVLYCTASIWGLCTIAVDRYTATVYPVWYLEKKSPTRALVYIIFVWMFSIIVSVAPFIGWRDMIKNFYIYNPLTGRQDCLLFMSETYVVYSAMGSFVIPTFLMVFLYVRIFNVLRKRTRSMQPMKKRIFYPSESDFESEGNALDDPDSTEKTDVELKAASTQTTPKNSKQSTIVENGTKPNSLNGFTDTGMGHDNLNNRNRPDILMHENKDANCNGTNLKIEVTDFTENDIASSPVPQSKVRKSKTSVPLKAKNCNLKVNYSNTCQTNGRKSPSHVSSKSLNFNEESSEADCEVKYLRSPRSSRAMFFPWKRGNSGTLSVKHKYELRERRATKRMAMIMACFCFCWWPFLFMYTIRSFCKNCPIDPHFQAAIIWLGYANSSLNPILYTIFNEDFRKAFQKIVFCKADSNNRRHR